MVQNTPSVERKIGYKKSVTCREIHDHSLMEANDTSSSDDSYEEDNENEGGQEENDCQEPSNLNQSNYKFDM